MLPLEILSWVGAEKLEDRRNVEESSCKVWRRNGSDGPILDVYDDDDDSCILLDIYRHSV